MRRRNRRAAHPAQHPSAPSSAPATGSSQPAGSAAEPTAVLRPAATAQAQPTPTPLPAEIIYQGKINVLIGGFGNERFIARYCSGLCHVYGRLLHAYLATTTHEGGVIPEVLDRWEINEDGTVWDASHAGGRQVPRWVRRPPLTTCCSAWTG